MSSRALLFLSLFPCAALLADAVAAGRALAAPPPASAERAAAQALPDADWIARASRQLAAREYAASASGAGFQAPNRRHNLRSYFEPTGVRVHDRTAPGEPRLLSLELAGVGRGQSLAPVPPGEVVSDGARVEIRRPGLVEWYLNSPEGLEQGFTFAERPAGEGPLVVALSLGDSEVRAAGQELRITSASGRQLAFGALVAFDAAGAHPGARFEIAAADRVVLVVDDRGARYPLTIDPLLTAAADAQFESNQIAALFGVSIAGAGDVNGDGYADLIIGASDYDNGQSNEGAAFVYHGSASGIPNASPTPFATQLESNQASAAMADVAGAGDVNGDGFADVIVGADGYDNGQSDEGAAFVFLGSATGIASGGPATAHATLESNQAGALFGGSVAGAGDVNGDGYADVIVGAEAYDSGQVDEGAAFVFLGSATGIASAGAASAHARLEANQSVALMGITAGAGDVNGDGYSDVIVGAPEYDSGQTNEGAAFVFLGSATGIPNTGAASAHARLESDQATAFLGTSVAGAGDVNGDGYSDVIVGAEEYNDPESNEGIAFVFHGSASGIANGTPATAAAKIESNQISALLGVSVAGIGDVNGDGYADVAVGADSYDNGQSDEGAVFVFLGSASGIGNRTPATAAAQLEVNQNGAALAGVTRAGDVNGDGYDDLLIAAEFYDNPSFNEGAAFLYLGGANGIASGNAVTAATLLESGQAGSAFGANLAGAGDVNGDGYADLIVGAEFYDSGEADEGAAFVYLGSASGIADGTPATAAAQLESNQSGSAFGTSVAGAGDVNGDGYADVIVGADAYDAGETDEGAAFVFHGSATGIASGTPASAAAQLESNQAGATLGGSVAGAGDVDGDGFADVIVGAEDYDAGELDEGAAFVFRGSPSGIVAGAPAAQLESNQVEARLGGSVAGAGDVKGDGYADVIVDAEFYDNGQLDEGAAFVFHGSASGIANGNPASAATQLESDQADAKLGGSLAAAGDVNGDGYADVIVGAELYDNGESDEGAAFVFLGSASGIASATPATAATRLESNQVSALLGTSVAGAGDVNGDGYADVIAAAGFYDNGELDEGAAFVFLGSASGIAHGTPATAAARLEPNQAGAVLDAVAAGVGDINGDGFADVVAGARGYTGVSGDGAVLVFQGNGNRDGRPVLAQQRRADASGIPVQSWGASGAESAFEVAVTATHPAGRGRVKLEVEACPIGTPFGAPQCTLHLGASWSDVTASAGGVRLVEGISVPDARTLHRWRARVLHAPFRVTEAGITPPPKPAHGPWRRVQAQALEADLYVPEPGKLALMLSGLAFLLALARRPKASAPR